MIPDLVITDSKGYKALAYDKMVPVLIEAIKEQQGIIKEQGKEISEKDARIEKLEKKTVQIMRAFEELSKRFAVIENPATTVAVRQQ